MASYRYRITVRGERGVRASERELQLREDHVALNGQPRRYLITGHLQCAAASFDCPWASRLPAPPVAGNFCSPV